MFITLNVLMYLPNNTLNEGDISKKAFIIEKGVLELGEIIRFSSFFALRTKIKTVLVLESS